MIELCYLLSAGILGVFAGAQIAEGVLFVPYWKELDPQKFFTLHKTYGPRFYRFYAPLTIAATLIPMGTAIYSISINAPAKMPAGLMGVFTLLFFATYFIFFKRANERFDDGSLTVSDLPLALSKWEKWHWLRISFELVALVCALAIQLF